MTLIEMTIVIVVIGVIAAALALFVMSPVRGYTDTVQRLQLVEQADFALRRITRDLGAALPNSVRTTINGQDSILEYMDVLSAARYCNANDCGDALFDGNQTFSWLSPAGLSVSTGNHIALANGTTADCDVYAASSNNRRTVSGINVNLITLSANAFSNLCAESNRRFFVVTGPVSFACDAANRTLWRYSGYGIQSAIPASVAALNVLSGVTKARLATDVECASTSFNLTAINENLLELRIQLMNGAGEKVNLYRQFRLEQAI